MNAGGGAPGLRHSPHDYRFLLERWKALARRTECRLERLAMANENEVVYLKTPTLTSTGGIYLSAGIHGDEPASTEALIVWAETNANRLPELPLILFPCLNPWGLISNQRTDATGTDLNRRFHSDDRGVISALKKVIGPYQFSVALMLHEDYDGQGLYLYEIKRQMPYWGEALLDAARAVIPIDPRPRIDRRIARNGLIRRRFDPRRFLELGFPEAIWLHQNHATRSLTIETPSEFALEQRVKAHVFVLDECIRRALVERHSGSFSL